MEVTNPFGWIEIPVNDMERAMVFYNGVFGWDLKTNIMGALQMAFFPHHHGGPGASGALVYHEAYSTSEKAGALVYFNCSDVADSLIKVKESGGQVISDKKLINEDTGYMGLALDSEGNRIAFYSRS